MADQAVMKATTSGNGTASTRSRSNLPREMASVRRMHRALPPGTRNTRARFAGDGILKLPSRLRRDLILMIVIKAAMLSLLYVLCFSPSHQPNIDTSAHIAGERPN